MTSYYYNSAGTDLDSIFYSANSSVGALGYYNSSGTDLGNKYASGSLGYGVGYYNSAGTDIGYLRGATAPTPSISVVFTKNTFTYGHLTAYPNESVSGDVYIGTRGLFTITPTITNYSSAYKYTCEIGLMLYTTTGDSSSCAYFFYPSTSDVSSPSAQSGETRYVLYSDNGGACGNRHNQYVFDGTNTSKNVLTGLSITRTNSYSIRIYYGQYWGGAVYMQFRCRVYNSSLGVYSNWVTSSVFRNNG